jgi:uncharacterized protein (UPF0335 family)
MDQREAISKLTKMYVQIQSIEEEIKEIKSEIKAEGMNASIIANVAKAVANNKVTELKEKSEETLEMIDISRS